MKKCHKCNKKSLSGLKGLGYCQYHWNVALHGKRWADHCEDLRRDVFVGTEAAYAFFEKQAENLG